MVWFFHFFFLCLLGLTAASATGQESIELLNLYYTTPEVVQASSHSDLPVAVSVSVKDLNEISTSVLMAESWLRTYVLAHYPANKVTTIVVGNDLLCQKDQEHNLGLILPCLRNIYYSVTRWGLEREIKVSPAFSSSCFRSDSTVSRDDMAEKVIKPLLQFLHTINSTYSINPPPMSSPSSDKTLTFVSSHLESIKKFGFLPVNKVNVLIHIPKKASKPLSRKLSDADSKIINPYPARPTPLPEISPLHSSIGYSIPATVASPQPPLSHSTSSPLPFSYPSAAPPPFSLPSDSPPPFSFPSAAPPTFSLPSDSPPPFSFPSGSPPPMPFSMAPQLPPDGLPASPPFGFLPPCNPVDNTLAPSPQAKGVVQSLWCVAKPSVPAETLQEAMDYACGEGGADCEEITPHGSCFNPDSLVAHASYAFNSYWQKTKRIGGTCSFGGTAMLINADPSYVHCRFVLS
ncbi:hypothetical protein ACOSQ2_023634 [Xanthoceras sorbifolium]